jgi:hypothetical protein
MANKSRKQQFRARFAEEVDDIDLNSPDFITVLKIVWFSVKRFFKERPAHIIGSAFILIMVWGYHGNLELLKYIFPDWGGPGTDPANRIQIIPSIPWDHELISFWAGAFLLVIIPILIIRFGFKQPLSRYGLGLPPKNRSALAVVTFFTLTIISLPFFLLGTNDVEMQNTYPLFRGNFVNIWQFLLFQLTYLPFFIAIEFIFRGYLLFGLAGVKDDEVEGGGGGHPGIFYFHKYAILIQMLSYTAWHLGKPTAELWGTLVWGLSAGATAYACRSVWPVIFSHWILNIFLDWMIARPF